MDALSPLLIMAAPNGARRTPRDHPALPTTPETLAAEARACLEAGAGAMHVHVRDRHGDHTLDADAYRAAFAAIERAVGGKGRLLLQATTEAAGRFQPPEQIAAARALRPEAISVAVRELAADSASEPAAAEFFAWLQRERIAVQYIVYSADDLRRFHDLHRRGIILGKRPRLLFVLGRYGDDAHPAQPRELLPFFDLVGELPWMVCAFGKHEAACAVAAAALGGQVRVGFENNLHLADGTTLAPGNAALVTQQAAVAATLGRPLADAGMAREILGCED